MRKKHHGHQSDTQQRYVDSTSVLKNCDYELLERSLENTNQLRSTIKFAIERENNNCLAFLDVLVPRDHENIERSVYPKSTCSEQYLHRVSNHLGTTKRGAIRDLVPPSCHTLETLQKEVPNIEATSEGADIRMN